MVISIITVTSIISQVSQLHLLSLLHEVTNWFFIFCFSLIFQILYRPSRLQQQPPEMQKIYSEKHTIFFNYEGLSFVHSPTLQLDSRRRSFTGQIRQLQVSSQQRVMMPCALPSQFFFHATVFRIQFNFHLTCYPLSCEFFQIYSSWAVQHPEVINTQKGARTRFCPHINIPHSLAIMYRSANDSSDQAVPRTLGRLHFHKSSWLCKCNCKVIPFKPCWLWKLISLPSN